MYKEASRIKLRVQTSKGLLSVEQLWELKPTPLSTILRGLNKELKKDNDDNLSFLDKNAVPVDKKLQLSFDIVKDIYLTKKGEADAAASAAEKKAKKQQILEIIQRKKNQELEGASIQELEAMLDENK